MTELDLRETEIIIRRYEQTTCDIEVPNFREKITGRDLAYVLMAGTPADREELFHILQMVKYSNIDHINLKPIHKWIRVKLKHIHEDEICCFCEEKITQTEQRFLKCDSI